MPNFEWVLTSESDSEKIYQIKNATSQLIRVCSPDANRQLNERLEDHKQNLRVGFYWIKDIHQQKKLNSEGNEDVARISYKESLERKFIDMGMSVKIQPLFNFVSECLNGDKLGFKKDPSGLVGKKIHVQSFNLIDSTFNGQTTKVYKVEWAILDYPIQSDGNTSGDKTPEVVFYPEGWEPEEVFYEEGWEPDEEPNTEGWDLEEPDLDTEG